MKKKFKIIDASTGEKLKLKEREMMLHKWVMNSQGIFFMVGNDGWYWSVRKLSDVCPRFDVVWVGEE